MWPGAWSRAAGTVAGATQRTDIEHGNKNLEIATVDDKHRNWTSTAAADRGEPTDTRTRHVADEVLGSSTGSHFDHICEVAYSGEQRPGTECTW